MTQPFELACVCGKTALRIEGAPIVSVECFCNSCRAAGARLQALPAAPAILDAKGATPFVLYRKDRVRFQAGAHLLREFRLSPESKTRRVVASCCNTPVFLEFAGGHWLSLYAGLWPAEALPPLEMRTMAGDLPVGTALPDDVPNSKSQSITFMVKLLGAWIAMGFRAPKIGFVDGELQV